MPNPVVSPPDNINAANMQARQIILANSLDETQATYGPTALAGTIPGQVINIPLRNVGMLKRLWIEIAGTVAQSAAETLTRTKFGPANILSNITLTDLNNQQRINCPGWFLHFLATARRASAFGAAFTNDSAVAIGSNNAIMTMPASVTTAQSFRFFYEVPIAYSDDDLRGAIYANVVNATFNLQITINPNFVLASGVDPTLGVYQSSTGAVGTLSAFSVTVYQNYLYGLPQGQGGATILPLLDLSTAYLLNATSASGMVVGQDFPVSYANFRDFLSTTVVFDNQALNKGTDVNYWALQSANYTNLWKLDPWTVFLLTRNLIGDDFPDGVYHFNHRRAPIRTVAFGNMQLLLNASSVAGSQSQILIGYEQMTRINEVSNAGSLRTN